MVFAAPEARTVRRFYFLEAMKERPIIFSGPMVRAILEGGKMRVWKSISPHPTRFVGGTSMSRAECEKNLLRWTRGLPYKSTSKKPTKNGKIWEEDNGERFEPIKYPFGKPGDRLWVRESFGQMQDEDGGAFIYRAGFDTHGENEFPILQWQPPSNMPRVASRILIEVLDVRVDRLREIGNADAMLTKGAAAMNYNTWAWVGDLKVITPQTPSAQ